MTTIQDYSQQAELALAAYAKGLYQGIENIDYREALEDDGDGMSPTQAANFASRWRVVEQYNHSGLVPEYDEYGMPTGNMIEYLNGLSATVFEEVSTGIRYLAVRGTDDLADALKPGQI